MKQNPKYNRLTAALFVIYLRLVTWIILFKLQFSLSEFGRFRSINLIPFAGSLIVNGKVRLSEIFENILVFVPVGIYLSMLRSDLSFLKRTALIAGYSLLLETLQYILAVGATDITDLIDNTLGGIIGIGLYAGAGRLIRQKDKLDKILKFLAAAGTVCLCALILILILANL